MNILFVYSAVFLASLILFDSAIRLLHGLFSRKRHLNYRLKLLEANQDRKAMYESMLKERAIGSDEHEHLLTWFRKLFAQSGLKIDWGRIILYSVAFLLFAWFVTGAILSQPILRGLIAIASLPLLYFFIVLYFRSQRINRFLKQLPDALDVITRSLGAGHPLPTSISLVAREMPDPIGSEFGILSDELTYGTDITVSMRNMVERVGADDLKLVAVSITVQRGTGGNLAEILSNLSDVLRQRQMMKAKIKSLSAEGRMTSWIMLGFPFFLYFMISALAPTYFDPVWESGYADVIFAIAAVIMTIGMIVLRKIVNFDF